LKASNRWTLEAKAPNVPIAIIEIEQAYTYANHPAVRAIYFCLCNGREFHIYQTHLGPDAEPIYATKYESLNEDFEAIGNTLKPDSIRRDWKAHAVDVGKPLGSGLRSLVKITGGFIEYEKNSLNQPLLNGLISTITGGSIYRDENGHLACYILTMSSHSIFQKFNERFDLHRMTLISEDLSLSTDNDRPTVFESIRDVVLPKGELSMDISTGRPVVVPFNMSMTVNSVGKGILQGDKFFGKFDAVFNVRIPRRILQISGHFEVNLS
jgi:hypothetical protein